MLKISWQQYALQLANTAKIRSEDPFQQVGACALDHSHRVLGVAYNGLKSGKNVEDTFWEDRDARLPFMLHAEVNLCSLFKKGDCKIVATTLLPCKSCAQMLCAYDVQEVVYLQEYERDSSAHEIFKFYEIKLTKLDLCHS